MILSFRTIITRQSQEIPFRRTTGCSKFTFLIFSCHFYCWCWYSYYFCFNSAVRLFCFLYYSRYTCTIQVGTGFTSLFFALLYCVYTILMYAHTDTADKNIQKKKPELTRCTFLLLLCENYISRSAHFYEHSTRTLGYDYTS